MDTKINNSLEELPQRLTDEQGVTGRAEDLGAIAGRCRKLPDFNLHSADQVLEYDDHFFKGRAEHH